MNTTLEIPEGSRATIQGKVIDGKHYLVVEVENKSDMIDIEEKARIMLEKTRAEMNPEFKRGDVLKGNSGVMVLFDKFYYEYSMERHALEIAFRSLINNRGTGNSCWKVDAFTPASDKEKAEFFKWLREEKGLEWDGEKLVEVLKEGDFAIFWDDNSGEARIAIYKRRDDDYGLYVDHDDLYWDNAIKWDGTKEQYEKLVEIPKRGDFVIVWDKYPQTAKIELFKEYNKYKALDKVGQYYRYKTKTDSFWINAIKWDGTKEQYEKVLRGEL